MGGYYAPGLMTSQMPAQPPTSSEAELINFDWTWHELINCDLFSLYKLLFLQIFCYVELEDDVDTFDNYQSIDEPALFMLLLFLENAKR